MAKTRGRGNKLRFQIVASDGRRSDVWRVWSDGSDVYLAPRSKGEDFKISLHASGWWRIAFTRKYAEKMDRLGTWNSDRCLEKLRKPAQHGPGFTRAVCLYFPDTELRVRAGARQETAEVVQVPGPSNNRTRIINLIFADPEWRLTSAGAYEGATALVSWPLSNRENLWVIHFEQDGLCGLDQLAEQYRRSATEAKKLDDRNPLRFDEECGRIMIPGTNRQGWFCILDAAIY